LSLLFSVLLTFEIFSYTKIFINFHSPPELFSVFSVVLGVDFVFAFDFVFPLLFSVSPRLGVSVVNIGFGCGSATL